MSPYLIAAIVIAALAAIIFAIHRIFPSVTVASAESSAVAEIKKIEADVKADIPDIEADAVAALTKGIAWLTDTTTELAQKAAADASIAKKAALNAKVVAALSAPPAI